MAPGEIGNSGSGVKNQRVFRLVVASFILFVALSGNPVQAENCAVPIDYRSDVRPKPSGPPTVVTIGVLVADVTGIDDVSQTIEADFIVQRTWRDARLASLANCRLQRSEVWFPITDVLNSNQVRRLRGEFASDQVSIKANGIVEYNQRFFGKVATYHSLQNFPFDSHRMRIRMASFNYPIDALQLRLNSEFTGVADLLNIPDWTIGGVEAEIVEESIPEFDATYSVLHFYILADRNPQYYVRKVMVPLLLIVLMSFAVFWINPERFGPQIGLAATSMLTLIAFQFALTSVLPKLSYFTLMDQLILGSTLLVFGSLVQATATTVLVDRGKPELAMKLDHICRWLFPILLIVIWGSILF